jgi:hypothetical protein
MTDTRVFGVRHHGPGSARSLRAAFEAWRPEVVLVEGPPDADPVLPFVGEPDMRAPVALMIHDAAEPRRAAFYPFADFSPEWVALRWALENGAQASFMDLPIRHQMAFDVEGWGEEAQAGLWEGESPPEDPLGLLARAAGDADGERWWSRMVEERASDVGAFEAIAEAMAALRDALGANGRAPRALRREALREAFMRKTIRAAEKRAARVAVVAGAWHVPALIDRPPIKQDTALLRSLPRRKVQATWVPWTHGRLDRESGYGAGVQAPGWYAHLFAEPHRVAQGWLTKVARQLRADGFDVPPSSVIDGARLAEALAAIRDRPRTGLEELRDATLALFVHGRRERLEEVQAKVEVGEVLGAVPSGTPEVPLAADIRRWQKSLRLQPKPEPKELVLDLREARGREKSVLLRRLELLDIPWGRGGERAEGRGSFKERWTLQWAPELALRVVDAARWGTAVAPAAEARARALLEAQASLPELSATTERILLADLPDLVPFAVRRLDAAAAGAADLGSVADALPALARLARYGDARGTSSAALELLLSGLVGRLAAGLPAAAAGLGPEPAEVLAGRIDRVDAALEVSSRPDWLEPWRGALRRLLETERSAPVCRGRAVRRLLDAGALTDAEARRYLERALARNTEPLPAARWLEGFLGGSALLLLHDPALLGVLDGWLESLEDAAFEDVLPALRRTFSSLEAPERRRLGARLRSGAPDEQADDLDPERARAGLAVAAWLLGLSPGDGG